MDHPILPPPSSIIHSESSSYTRVAINHLDIHSSKEDVTASQLIQKAREIRSKWMTLPAPFDAKEHTPDHIAYALKNGVYSVTSSTDGSSLVPSLSLEEYIRDYDDLRSYVEDGSVRTFSHKRVKLLEQLFDLHVSLNMDIESKDSSGDGADFYSITKVDNHVHLAAAYNARKFLLFMKDKMLNHRNDVVEKDGRTLGQVIDGLGISPEKLTVDTVGITADVTLFDRFDRFNMKYSPLGQGQLRSIFLKSDNVLQGRYMAELTKSLLVRMERKGETHAEYRLSIYGTDPKEWEKLAKWVITNDLLSPNVKWMVQVPRVYRIHRKGGFITSFNDLIRNTFDPLFAASLYPEKHPYLSQLLDNLGGFDSVDDESLADEPLSRVTPEEWTSQTASPSYAWQLYYMSMNVRVLNGLRSSLGLNTFTFRPHAGESGDIHHLTSAYLLSHGINHGVNLQKKISLWYLYYLDRIGISVSPMSNNYLFLKISQSPFLKFFKSGLNVTLSTDDPLFFHLTDDPLLEEYAVARQHWMLSVTDMSEIARNSVLQSSYSHEWKAKRLGDGYLEGRYMQDRTNVPAQRDEFRSEALKGEISLIKRLSLL